MNRDSIRYRPYTLSHLRNIPQVTKHLSPSQIDEIEMVAHVLPFRTNNYMVQELIDWRNVPDDPLFKLNFPHSDMLLPDHHHRLKGAISSGNKEDVERVAGEIRLALNPHPAGQLTHNVPMLDGERLDGVQHKYRETVLFFPSQGQTCHAYCTFCFRWPQFVGMEKYKFASNETKKLKKYIQHHPQVTDVLITGGDPLIMRTRILKEYIEPLLEIPHLRNIRIGSKALSYWPYRFVTDPDADELLELFKFITDQGKHLALMAHFNHIQELRTGIVCEAIERIRATGAEIRTQSPILRNLNDDADLWASMWKKQVNLGMIPYYMFVVRNTGAQHYFALPLIAAWKIFRQAYQQVSGLARTVRGPSMSCNPGKIMINGVAQLKGQRVIVLQTIQGRKPQWVGRPFFAEYDEEAMWMSDLQPAFGKKSFYFEDELASFQRRRAQAHNAIFNTQSA